MTTEIITTCQICGRAIKSKKGFIAHHGYQRPGMGWQTASCDGAGNLPYEVSCEALKRGIQRRGEAREGALLRREQMIADPPATLSYRKRYAGREQGDLIQLARPEGFDSTAVFSPSAPRVGGTYESLFRTRCNEQVALADGLRQDIEFLQGRLAAWKAPTEVAA